MLKKRTYKNQITIPKSVIEAFPGVQYFDVQRLEKEIVLKPVMIDSRVVLDMNVIVSELVSGDHHLLALKKYRRIPIVSAAIFLARVG